MTREQSGHLNGHPGLKEDERDYFQQAYGVRKGQGRDVDQARRPDQTVPGRSCSGSAGSINAEDVGPSRPWWTRLPKGSDASLAAGPAPLCSGPGGATLTRDGGGGSRRFGGGQIQEAVLKDLLDARRRSKGRADTPADLLLALLSDMLLGLQPNMDDVELARSVLMRHVDPYLPLNLGNKMREANLDADVVSSLMLQLGAAGASHQHHGQQQKQTEGAPGHDSPRNGKAAAAYGIAASASAVTKEPAQGQEEAAITSLRDALALLLAQSSAAPASAGLASSRAGTLRRGSGSRSGSDNGDGSGSGPKGGTGSSGEGCLQSCASVSVPHPMLDDVERALAGVDDWQFNSWRLAEASQGHALSCLGFYLLQREGLISQFRIPAAKLARLLRTIESGYTTTPYHNSTHAADVLQTLHVLLRGSGLREHYLDRLGLLAAYFAAIVHDHGHPGLTADFLINTSHPLAVRYNDRSPLENHHGASFFQLLKQRDMDALAQLSGPEKSAFRKQVIDLIMATDMKQHFSLLAHFNTAHQLAPYNKEAGPAGAGASRRPRPSGSGGDGADAQDAEAASSAPKPRDETERMLSLQVALKAADLGHLGEELSVHKRWVSALEEEFFLQGDRERELGLSISPLFDRTKQGVSKSQVGFFDFIALPLVHALAGVFPGAQPLLQCYVANYDYWREAEKAAAAAAAAASSAAAAAAQPEAKRAS